MPEAFLLCDCSDLLKPETACTGKSEHLHTNQGLHGALFCSDLLKFVQLVNHPTDPTGPMDTTKSLAPPAPWTPQNPWPHRPHGRHKIPGPTGPMDATKSLAPPAPWTPQNPWPYRPHRPHRPQRLHRPHRPHGLHPGSTGSGGLAISLRYTLVPLASSAFCRHTGHSLRARWQLVHTTCPQDATRAHPSPCSQHTGHMVSIRPCTRHV